MRSTGVAHRIASVSNPKSGTRDSQKCREAIEERPAARYQPTRRRSLTRDRWGWHEPCKQAVVRVMSKPLRLLQNYSTGCLLRFSYQLQKSLEFSPQSPSPTGVGCPCYTGDKNYV